jgi:uncharacterized protein (UPF0332 family)
MEGLSVEEKIALSDVRFKKSKEMLSDANNSFKTGMYKTSVNRSYYAVLHSARALLILKGVDPVRHDGIKTMMSLHFVKAKILSQEVIKIFKNLLSLRTDVDYGDFETVNKNDAGNAVKQAKIFIKIVESVRKNLIKELSSDN